MSSLAWAHDSHPWGHPRPTLCRPWAQARERGAAHVEPWEARARAGGVGVKRAERARGLPLCGGSGAEPPERTAMLQGAQPLLRRCVVRTEPAVEATARRVLETVRAQ